MLDEATTRVQGRCVYTCHNTIPEIQELLNSQPEGKPVARQLAPMISTFIRGAQWESEEVEDVDDERRQIFEEAAELEHIWGV
jgi:hypothetical protein